MSHLVLLGDSILDNGAYVGNGPSILAQIQEQLSSPRRATLLALDGSVIEEVHEQLERLPNDASHLVLSVGGNDVLHELALLGSAVNTVGEGLERLAELRDRFNRDYLRLMEVLRSRGLPVAVCTIYEPRFPEVHLQRQGVTGLCLFNDAILRAAHAHGFPVLDLRTVCTAAEDFANSIEPSSVGGAKIAGAIIRMVDQLEGLAGRTCLFPIALNHRPNDHP